MPCTSRAEDIVASMISAIRVVVCGASGAGLREATVERARVLGVQGWVRAGAAGELLIHAEGAPAAVDELVAFLRGGTRGDDEAGDRARSRRGPRAVRDPRRERGRLRRAGARGDRAPLRPAPRGRWRDALVGGPEGAVAGPRRQAHGDRGRRPRDRPQHLRGRARGRPGDRLGPRRPTSRAAASPGRRRCTAAMPSSSCTARSCGAGSPCSAPARDRRRAGC